MNPLLAENEIAKLRDYLAAKDSIAARAPEIGLKRNERLGVCDVTGADVKSFAGFERLEHGRRVVYSFVAAGRLVGVKIEPP